MNRRELFKGASALGLAASTPCFVSRAVAATTSPSAAAPVASPRQVLLLNKGWRFFNGDIPFPPIMGHDATYDAAKAGAARAAASPSYDDSEWPEVSLPHDFVSFQPIEESGNVDQGYRKRGVVWYRNVLKFDKADRGKHIELQLDGVATFATVWFNGTLVDRNWSGYNSIYIDLSPYATYGEQLNSLVVRVDAEAMEGWWYEGGGIYRDAWIVKRNPVHIKTDGIFAHPVKGADGWLIPVEVTLNNMSPDHRSAEVTCDLLEADGSIIASGKMTTDIDSLQDATVRFDIKVPGNLRLWSTDTPNLYTVRTRLYPDANIGDEVITTCGFRTQRFDAQKGFFLNDQPVKIKGVCLHQDHAGVGTAVPEGILDFRLRRLKSLGCNAIRFSHNAQSKQLMDACDRHGFLVMAENRNFNASTDYLEQLAWLVRRDRNHPSVYLWSVFNEEPMQGTEAGYEMVRRMSSVVKSLDTTRPVTAAMSGGLFTPLNVSHAVDVVGINYQQSQYDPFHAAHPDKPVFSSEDSSALMTRGAFVTDKKAQVLASYDDERAPWGETHRDAWKQIDTRDFVAGTFVWTGFDYHGEPKPFSWPSNSSYFGIMDLCGFDKTAVHIHRAQWIKNKPVLGLVPHWNWAGSEGKPVMVMACTNAEEVELFVNGKSAGRQKTDKYDMNRWTVPYAPGRIEARAYNAGKAVSTVINETTGDPVALRLTADRPSLSADGRDAQPIMVEAVDAKDRTVPLANHMVTWEISGGAIIGLGNGDPTSLEPEKGNKRSLFNGLGQVIVQSIEAQPGVLKLRATAPGLKAANLIIPVKAGPILPSQPTAASVQILNSWFRAPYATARPDPNQKADDSDMNSWQWFRPGELLQPATSDGWSLVAARYTPFAKVQRAGGTMEFLNITGACEIYVDGQLLGTKSDPAPGPFSVKLSPFTGQRRVSVLFHLKSGEPYGFSDVIRTRA